jgi:D-amino-acid dehydrogenase
MRVVVLGSGVVGVSSAWYLANEGHEVVVVDRQPAAGMETSFANAGQVSPGYAWPWAAPGIPLKVAKWMLTKHSPFRIYPRADPAMWRWMLMMLRECNSTSYGINKSRMTRVAEYSRECLADLRHLTGITYDGRQAGLIQLFRTQKQYDAAAKDIKIMREAGVACELLDPDACVVREPGLRGARADLTGGLLMPGDESGDAHLFTQRLAAMAAERGVEFRYGATIEAILTEGDRITGVRTDRGMATGDAYLVALGSHGARLLKPIGIDLPVYPVKGYSITVPVENEEAAPRSTVADETYKVAITRLGDRIRAGGTAELSGYNSTLRPGRRETLEQSVGSLFKGACDFSKATFWTGLRPNTPDGTPIIGNAGRYRNLWLNTGHGTLGWTMSCGSGRLISDLISGRRPNIEYADLSLDRYAA